MKSKSKSVFYVMGILSALALVSGALYLSRSADSGNNTQSQQAILVAAEEARAKTVPTLLMGIGELEATRQVMVTSESSGLVTAILFNAGARVHAGQTLVQLNDAPEQGQLIKLKAESVNAKAQLARTRTLFRQQAATQEQLDQVQANWQQLQGEIVRVQALIDQKRIKAPFSGVLGVRKVNTGQFIQAGDGMVSLTDAGEIYANITLPEHALPVIKTGLKMKITVDAYPNQTFSGTISTIEPMIDRGTRTLLVQATLVNSDNRLSPGMFVKGSISLPDPQRIVSVPETAISYNAYGDFIYVVDKNDENKLVARQVYVQTGRRDGNHVAIVEGIKAGVRVITSGQLRINNGAPVEIASVDTLATEDQSAHSVAQ